MLWPAHRTTAPPHNVAGACRFDSASAPNAAATHHCAALQPRAVRRARAIRFYKTAILMCQWDDLVLGRGSWLQRLRHERDEDEAHRAPLGSKTSSRRKLRNPPAESTGGPLSALRTLASKIPIHVRELACADACALAVRRGGSGARPVACAEDEQVVPLSVAHRQVPGQMWQVPGQVWRVPTQVHGEQSSSVVRST